LRPPPATVLFDVIDDVVVTVTHVPAAAAADAKMRFSSRHCELVLAVGPGVLLLSSWLLAGRELLL